MKQCQSLTLSTHNETSVYAKFQDYPTQVILEKSKGHEDIMIADSRIYLVQDQSQEKIENHYPI